ncbi:MAG: hypothetical protein EOS59_19120 [Mesorhizobium sp.]|nr:MAG: hypothetical protein EOS59_19120 [Mesorhizobium sp.]RWF13389.1 MAG: hypothetical protein EOS69_01505 [Mesorhizobium sp.]
MRAISLFAGVLMARWRRCNLALSIIGTQIHGCVSPTPDRQGSTFLCLSAAQPEPEVLTLVGHSRLKFAPGKRTFTGTSGFDPFETFWSPYPSQIRSIERNQRS